MLSQLNRRVALEAQTLTPDCGGGYSAGWNTVATVWAAIEPVSGADVFGPDAPRGTGQVSHHRSPPHGCVRRHAGQRRWPAVRDYGVAR